MANLGRRSRASKATTKVIGRAGRVTTKVGSGVGGRVGGATTMARLGNGRGPQLEGHMHCTRRIKWLRVSNPRL